MVLKVGGGHNCWVADPSACADTMLVWIKTWIGAGSASDHAGHAARAAGADGRQRPSSSPWIRASAARASRAPSIRCSSQFCSRCHTLQLRDRRSSRTSPAPTSTRPTPRRRRRSISRRRPSRASMCVWATEFHNCWATPAGGAPDCPGSAAAMLTAIKAFANGIPVTQIDPTLVRLQGADAARTARSPRAATATRPTWSPSTSSRPARAPPPTTPAASTRQLDLTLVGQRHLGRRLGHQLRHGRQGAGLDHAPARRLPP